ncbi:hypothetical protein Tco_0709545, partial [Tanacetum coccineum]
YVSIPTKEQETPSFANQQVKTPRETVKNRYTHSKNPKVDNKKLGYGFTPRACFVCGSLNRLIKDCDFHEKRMAKQAELNNGLNRNSRQREIRQIWNNVQRVNKQNQFVPSAVLTRTGKIPVNTVRTSGTKNISTARHNFNRQAVLTSTAMKVNTVKPIMNRVRPANVFHKPHSPFSRPLNNTTALRTNFSKQKVNTAKVNAVSAVGGKRETAVKPSAGCNWRPQRHNWHNDYPHRALQNKGIVDSGCSRHMTGNKAYLAEYQDFNGGPVAFGGSKGYITGKGKIKTGKLDFEDVCFVKELQHFNLFSVSQMCDKKNKVLFTDSECLVLSPEFKLPDENQRTLNVPVPDTVPPMLDKTDFAYGNTSSLILFGGTMGVNILKSIDKQHVAHANENKDDVGGTSSQQQYSDHLACWSNVVVVQNVQGRQNRGQGNNARGAGAAGYGRAQKSESMLLMKMWPENGSGLRSNDAICEHHEEHGMQDDVQPSYIADSYADYTSDSNITPYDQYVKDNAVPVVQNNAYTVPNDIYNKRSYEMSAVPFDGVGMLMVCLTDGFYVESNLDLQCNLDVLNAKKLIMLFKPVVGNLKAELSNLLDNIHKDNYNELLNRFSNLEINHLNLQLKYQNLKDSFQNKPSSPGNDTPDFNSVFVIGQMKASLQGKDNVIQKLKMKISHLKETVVY